ncbi:MAG: hypothetical protein HYZ49_19910 [Chloroflexi bacterium]|nr:hypothetical protein [Chloroflexota bacterium]
MNAKSAQAILSLAQQSDILIFGETHGTQEVPQVLAAMLDDFRATGFCALGLEAPLSEQNALANWAKGETTEAPSFFARPFADGRGNEQALALAREAIRKGWHVICFDVNSVAPGFVWAERDNGMAENLVAEWERLGPDCKVVCLCGNLHSRLAPLPKGFAHFWPSFAARIQQLKPNAKVNSINIMFHGGSFFNTKVQQIAGRPITEDWVSEDAETGHSLVWHLPQATPATFLAPPTHFF